MTRLRALLGACALLLAGGGAAAQDAALQSVNPELRPIARAILRAQQSGTPFVPPKPGPLPDGVIERQVAGAPGAPPVPVFVINAPAEAAPARPAVLFIHGGGFVAGDARDNLRALKSLAERQDCVIVSVQYRLAPDTPFPGPVDDLYAALEWLHAQSAALGVDPARIAIVGESAGGGLAAMLSLRARDRGGPAIAFEALIYPMLDDRTGSSVAVPPHIGTLIWTPAQNRKGWTAFLGHPPGGRTAAKGAVPARAVDLSRLPPSFIAVGSIDLFADEDIDFARRLVRADVPTELLVVPGAFHGFQLAAPRAAVSRQFSEAFEAALGRALHPLQGRP